MGSPRRRIGVIVTEPSFLALQGIDELLETRDLVSAWRAVSPSSRSGSRCVVPSEPRAGLPARKLRRPHPASPEAVGDRAVADVARRATPVGPPAEADLVMLCVRVPPSLRRRLKLVAVANGRPIQALATEALVRRGRR